MLRCTAGWRISTSDGANGTNRNGGASHNGDASHSGGAIRSGAAMPTPMGGGFRRGQGVTPIAAEAASARIVLLNMLFSLYAGLLAQPGVIVLLPFGSSTILALIG